MTTQHVDLVAFLPPILTFATALLILVGDLFTADKRWLQPVAVFGTLAAAGAVAALAVIPVRRTFCDGNLCSYAEDRYAVVLQFIVLFATCVVLLLTATTEPAEHLFLLHSAVTGALVLASARDLLILVVALEALTLPTIVLVALRRRDPRAAEASLQYFLVSVVSLALTLLGAALLYGVTGDLHLTSIAARLAHSGVSAPVTRVAVVLVLAGFIFKIAAVPFHAWAPPAYENGPVPIAAFLSVASKTGGFAALVAIVVVGLRGYADVWSPVLGAIAAVTITTGNLVALRQRHAIRLMAWSSIAQGGYVLAPLGAVAAGGHAPLATAVGAVVTYLAIYAAMNIGAFACLAAIRRHRPSLHLAHLRGLVHDRPLLAVALAFFFACLAGLPPGVAGLFAKVVLFRALVDGSAGWLLAVVAVNTVLGLYYYAAVAFSLFAERDASDEPPPDDEPASRRLAVAVAVAAAATVALSVYPQLAVRAGEVAAAALT